MSKQFTRQDTHFTQNGFIGEQESRTTLHPDTLFFLQSALDDEDITGVKQLIADMHTGDIAEIINYLDPQHREAFVATIGDDFNPDILVRLEGAIKDDVVDFLGVEHSAEAITQLETDDAITVIQDLKEESQHELLEELEEEKRAELEEGLAYPEDSAGRLMNPNFVSMDQLWTVGQAIDYLREPHDMPTDFHEIYVLDDLGRPRGGILTSRVIRMKRDTALMDIIAANLRTINATTDQEEVAFIFRKYGLVSAPVINDDGVMVGVLSLDDVIEIVEDEAEEDIMRLAGVSDYDINSSAFHIARYRSSWLFLNLLTAIAASAVIALFEVEIGQLVALAVMMPIVASMAGNAGTQTMTVTVRALAAKEISDSNVGLVTQKEFLASICNGVIFALIVAGISFLVYQNLTLSLVFGGAISLSLALAALAGVFIPVMLEKSGADPAVASTVFLTTVTDISAFFIFLGLAKLFLFA